MKLLNVVFMFLFLIASISAIKADEVGENTTASTSNLSVSEDDIAFYRLESYNLTKANLPIHPYFEVYEWNETSRGDRICKTRATEKFAITQKVIKPWKYEIEIPKETGKSYVFCVRSDFKNLEVASGEAIPFEKFKDWKDSEKTYELEISPGNKIVLRFMEEKKKVLVFQIESFQITNISDSFLEKLKDHSQMWVRFSHNQEKEQEFEISSRLRNKDLRMEDILVDFEYKTDYKIEFYNDELGTLASFQFNAGTLLENLKNGKEEFLLTDGEVHCKLLYNGIRRIYRVKTIIIPEIAPVRAEPRPLLATEDPKLRLWIQEDGRNCGITRDYATPGIRRTWQADFPDEEGNRFMIREGKNHSYTIHIEDRSPWFDSPMIAELMNLTDQSFKEKEIVQTLSKMQSKERAIRVIVEEVKTK